MAFLRTLGESCAGKTTGVALALFAHIATPQVRLTKDPNTYFFFLDHLDTGSPFRLEDDASWDTNIERGIYWGLRLLEKDEEIKGKSANAKAFILISDGQAWSGEVAKSLPLVAGDAASRCTWSASGPRPAASSRIRSATPHKPAVRSDPRSDRRCRPSPPRAAGATSSSTASPTARSPARSSTSPVGAPAARAWRRRSTIATASSCWARRVWSSSASCSCAIRRDPGPAAGGGRGAAHLRRADVLSPAVHRAIADALARTARRCDRARGRVGGGSTARWFGATIARNRFSGSTVLGFLGETWPNTRFRGATSWAGWRRRWDI